MLRTLCTQRKAMSSPKAALCLECGRPRPQPRGGSGNAPEFPASVLFPLVLPRYKLQVGFHRGHLNPRSGGFHHLVVRMRSRDNHNAGERGSFVYSGSWHARRAAPRGQPWGQVCVNTHRAVCECVQLKQVGPAKRGHRQPVRDSRGETIVPGCDRFGRRCRQPRRHCQHCEGKNDPVHV
jgi:hypothetical protein